MEYFLNEHLVIILLVVRSRRYLKASIFSNLDLHGVTHLFIRTEKEGFKDSSPYKRNTDRYSLYKHFDIILMFN